MTLFSFQHSCVKARVNGRDGVIVAGGASDADPNLNLVEFFDINSHRWKSLGRTRQGRRFPGLMVMGKHLLVAGGETTGKNKTGHAIQSYAAGKGYFMGLEICK